MATTKLSGDDGLFYFAKAEGANTPRGIQQQVQRENQNLRALAEEDDGPATLLDAAEGGAADRPGALTPLAITGDWNGDGQDALGVEADSDGDTDAADFLV